jgi:TRAP-type C4-dicarboxylate transport system substrate-binding protein
MKAHNVTITAVSPEEKKRFQDAMKPIWEKYGAKHAAMLDRIQAIQ